MFSSLQLNSIAQIGIKTFACPWTLSAMITHFNFTNKHLYCTQNSVFATELVSFIFTQDNLFAVKFILPNNFTFHLFHLLIISRKINENSDDSVK
jgi:hypothetical protein